MILYGLFCISLFFSFYMYYRWRNSIALSLGKFTFCFSEDEILDSFIVEMIAEDDGEWPFDQ